MALEDLQDRLKDDPEAVMLTVAGEEYPFLLSGLGMERARQQADPIPLLFDLFQRYSSLYDLYQDEDADLDDVQKKAKEMVKGGDLKALSVIIWSGFLTFDDDISIEEVQIIMTPGRVVRHGMDIANAITNFVRDIDEEELEQVEDDTGEEVGN